MTFRTGCHLSSAGGYVAMCLIAVSMLAAMSANALVITNREGLVAITNDLAGTYALDADIDLGGADWTPVGNDSAPFTGSFHGNGHAVRNLVCTNNPSGNSSRGLSGCVDSRGGYVGAFVGKANTGLVTNSYYDTSANGQMEAVGKNAGGSTAYTGITPIDLGEKYHAASYPSFDFTNTWSIAGGVDEPRLMPLTGFTDFLDDCYLPLNTDQLLVTNGVPMIARYVYGIVPLTATTDAEGRPLVDFGMGVGGPVFTLAPQKNCDDYGLAFSILWSRDLSPWQTIGEIRFDADGDGDDTLCHPPVDTGEEPRMFFRYRITLEN